MTYRPAILFTAIVALATTALSMPAGSAAAVQTPVDRRLPVADLAPNDRLSMAGQAVVLVRSRFPSAPGDVLDTSETGSGVLVAPCLVLTARHVLGTAPIDPAIGRSVETTLFSHTATGEFKPSTSMAVVRAAGGGFGVWTNRSVTDDWALLELKQMPANARPVALEPVDSGVPQSSRRVALVGFPADHFDPAEPRPWVDPDCRVTEQLANRMLVTSCVATSGNSGGPLLVLGEGGWRLAGLLTRAAPLDVTGRVTLADNFVLPLTGRIRGQIEEIARSNRCPPPTGEARTESAERSASPGSLKPPPKVSQPQRLGWRPWRRRSPP
ncbi:serine protease [Caulobacter sp. SL161]|uniref:trypsin-like serine peptidase n=1 Tax=Caulobacter sp. SL161 TaxID=2995156 RepID=UPI00227356A3|nr:serine protease [Caulobacter sp. SL161]MCY1647789.1 serine protease [Caulobacter sp. SL161]